MKASRGHVLDEVVDVFSQLLEAVVEPDDDFFAMGGDSLLALAAVHALEQRLSVVVGPAAVLSNPSSRALAAVIEASLVAADAGDITGLRACGGGGHLIPLSPIQESHVVTAPTVGSRGFLNWVYQLNGRLDDAALVRAFDDLVQRHAVLRTSIEIHDGGLFQRARPFTPGVLKCVAVVADTKAEAIDQAVADADRTFRSLAPLVNPGLQAVLYRIDKRTSVLAMFVAECLVDAESGSLIAAEISRRYATHAGVSVPLGTIASQESFLEHVASHPVSRSEQGRATSHWRRFVRPPSPALEYWSGEDTNESTAFELTAAEWHHVAAAARTLRVTPYSFVFGAFQVAIAECTGVGRFLIDAVVIRRDSKATAHMIGSFHSEVRVACEVEIGAVFEQNVLRAARAVREAVDHSAVPVTLAAAREGLCQDSSSHNDRYAFHMFRSQEGLTLSGLRRRRFRLHGPGRHAVELTSAQREDGRQTFSLSSSRATHEWLAQLTQRLRTVLEDGSKQAPYAGRAEDS